MRFKAYFQHQLRQLILRPRWLLILPVMGFIAFLLSNALTVENFQSVADVIFDSRAKIIPTTSFNSWDALFVAFGNADYMTFMIANLFLLLVCDSLPEKEFGQLAVFRLGSRRKWWLAKSLSMLVAALVYVFASMLILFGVSGLRMGFDWKWSIFANYAANILVGPFNLTLDYYPLAIAAVVFGLCTLGFWALGMLMQVVNLLTRRSLFGYGAAMLALIGSLVLSDQLINVPNWALLIPPLRNLILTHSPYPFRRAPIWWSYVYWGIWIALLGWVGSAVCRKLPFISKHNTREEGQS